MFERVERGGCFSALVRQIHFEVVDLERGQLINQKDFINKNFAK